MGIVAGCEWEGDQLERGGVKLVTSSHFGDGSWYWWSLNWSCLQSLNTQKKVVIVLQNICLEDYILMVNKYDFLYLTL